MKMQHSCTSNSKIKRIIEAFAFLILLLLSSVYASNRLQDKNCIYKNKDFFAEKNQFDVLFFGSSHMELFVSPMELWKKYGITSYNFGAPEEGLPVTYWVMANAFDINKPKVAVVDMHMFNLKGNYSSDEHVHYALDAFPISKTKIDAINDLSLDFDNKMELFFPIGKYHGRWKSLNKASYENIENYSKGSMSYGYWHTMNITPFEQYPLINKVADISEDSEDVLYLKKIIQLCEDEDVELLLVSNPYWCNEDKQSYIHKAEKIAGEYSVPYINFVDMNSVINMQIDMYDEGHVNQSGMHKITDYLGNYLCSCYDFENHDSDELYIEWNKDYEDYKQLKYESISVMAQSLDVLFECLNDDDINSYIYLGPNANMGIDDNKIGLLLENIGSSKGKIIDEITCNRILESVISGYDEKIWDLTNYVIIITDANTDEVKIIRKFVSADCCEDLYNNVEKKYIE